MEAHHLEVLQMFQFNIFPLKIKQVSPTEMIRR